MSSIQEGSYILEQTFLGGGRPAMEEGEDVRRKGIVATEAAQGDYP